MLTEEQCKDIFNQIINHRKSYEADFINIEECPAHALYISSHGLDKTSLVSSLHSTNTDVYDLLRNVYKDGIALNTYFVALYTQGWASPNDESELPPSQHPDAKRVKLICIMSKDSSTLVQSVLSIDGEKDIRYDSSGTGKISDALRSLYKTKEKGNIFYGDLSAKTYYF